MPYLIASEKILESIPSSRLMVEGFRVLPFSNSASRRSFLYFSTSSGEIWANVWQTDLILLIDPATGRVKKFLNLKGIRPASERKGTEDVLNGIAYDAEQKRIFVSGKLWPRLFEIKLKS